jgi:hypothetical protein
MSAFAIKCRRASAYYQLFNSSNKKHDFLPAEGFRADGLLMSGSLKMGNDQYPEQQVGQDARTVGTDYSGVNILPKKAARRPLSN